MTRMPAPPPLPNTGQYHAVPPPPPSGNVARDFGLLLIRLMVATVFVFAGSQKLFKAFDGFGMEAFMDALAGMRLPIDRELIPAAAWTAAISEFACGILVAIGLFTRVFAIPLVCTMAVAVIYAGGGHFVTMQYPLVMGVISLALVFTGPGRISLDGAIFRGRG